MKKVVTIGGGTGHSQVLKALKQIKDVQITGICPSTDSGGSTGVLEKEYGGSGYTGDLTKCILALSDNETLATALAYRYQDGPLHAHSVKNLLFHALQKVSSTSEALEIMGQVCGLGIHTVLPVTNEKTELCASLRMGNTVFGETNIDTIAKNPLWNPEVHSISNIYLKPHVSASKEAVQAIQLADTIIVCPGDLYSSIIPVLLPSGMKESLQMSSAKIVLVLNIMTKMGETDNYTASDFVQKIETRLGRPVDYILYNDSPIPEPVLLNYSLEQKVELGDFLDTNDIRMIPVPLALVNENDQIVSDPIVLMHSLQKLL
jgi:uncharacterized cofD-like protein